VTVAIYAIALFIVAGGIVAWRLIQGQVKGGLKNDIRTEPRVLDILPPDLGSGARRLARQYRGHGKGTLAPAWQEQICQANYSDPLTIFPAAQAFDANYAILWQTQVPALQFVDAAGLKGVHVRQLYRFYSCSTRLYPELFDNSTFGSWLQFLERERLINRIGTRVLITAEGHHFLEFISSLHCGKPA
jgi:hypothetical protein